MNQKMTSVTRPSIAELTEFRALMAGSIDQSSDKPAPADLLTALSPWQNDGGPTDINYEVVSLGDYEGWEIKARVYTPKVNRSDLTRVLFLHGGAWVMGNPASHDKLARQITEMGCEVWSLDYPRAPRSPFPAAFNTVVNTIDQLVRHGTQQIITAGDSAGGGLAASAALARPEAVAAIALLYPVLDYRNGFAFVSRFYSHLETDGRDPYLGSLAETLDPNDYRLNPLAHVKDLPPTWVTFGELDPLADQSKTLERELATANTACEVFAAPGSGHAFMQDPDDANVDIALASLHNFLQQQPASNTGDIQHLTDERMTTTHEYNK